MNPDESSAPREARADSALRFDGPERLRLSLLDRRSVAVHLFVQGEERWLSGRGSFERDPELGDVLRISFPDHPDDGEFLVVENRWTGQIEPGDAVGCDFLIRLA
jgi:hypothetical protein